MTRTYRVIGALSVRHLGLPSDRLMIAPMLADNRLADAIMKDCLKGGILVVVTILGVLRYGSGCVIMSVSCGD